MANDADFERAAPEQLDELRAVSGLTPAVSDALDRLGCRGAVGAWSAPRRAGAGNVAGQAVTLLYLPRRDAPAPGMKPMLAHRRLFATAARGDVAVFASAGGPGVSVMGGLAAAEAAKLGLGGVVVDGAVRDLEEIRATGLSAWSAGVSPVSGTFRLEAAAINIPVAFGGIQARPGDIVVADDTGICFIPLDRLAEVVALVRQFG